MRIQKKKEEREALEKLSKLEIAQEEAKKQMAQKRHGPAESIKAEIVTDSGDFMVKETKGKDEEEKTKHIDFIPDFDVDEVPPLE